MDGVLSFCLFCVFFSCPPIYSICSCLKFAQTLKSMSLLILSFFLGGGGGFTLCETIHSEKLHESKPQWWLVYWLKCVRRTDGRQAVGDRQTDKKLHFMLLSQYSNFHKMFRSWKAFKIGLKLFPASTCLFTVNSFGDEQLHLKMFSISCLLKPTSLV